MQSWPLYAFAAMCCFATMQLVFAHLSRAGLSPASILVVVFGVGAMLYLAHVGVFGTPLPPRHSLMLLFIAGGLGYLGNLAAVRAVGLAPNPGYAVAIFGLQALVVTIVSLVVLGASLTWIKVAGVLLCFAGVALLVV